MYTFSEGVLITDDMIERDDSIEPRAGQPCWCPDSFIEACFYVRYCPRHGSVPDQDLWNFRVAPYGIS
jgi:hypothetical protein